MGRAGPTIDNVFISQTQISSGTSSRSRIEETGEGLGEIGQVIAFGALGPDSHDARVDSEGLERASQPTQCSVRSAQLGVAAAGVGAKCLHELFRGDSDRAGLGEDLADVRQEKG